MSYWSRSFRGMAECLSEVRQFTAAVLGDRPGVDLVVLAVSELAGNAILHTASGEPGGQFVVHLAAFADRWQIRVDDAGGPGCPRIRSTGPCDTNSGAVADLADVAELAEAGRGLALVAAVSRDWGVLGDGYARAVWAEIPRPRPEASAESAALPQQATSRPERVPADAR
jgi:anti-sigma regulatory factor (Ser/Thr protein kinase)